MDSCAICHTQPAIGGSSSTVNLEVQRANVFGAKNVIPLFINLHGPVREARFKYNPDGTRNGRWLATAESTGGVVFRLTGAQHGPGLADDIIKGTAGPDEFRTVPLWGAGQRVFFLHDGRTAGLLQAILFHASPANEMFPASEANQVIANFLALSPPNRQKIPDVLRSL